MEYVLEKKGYNTLKVSSSAYGTLPTIVSYDRILNYIRDMVRGNISLYDLSFSNHTLYIKKVVYEERCSFLVDEILIIDSSLELDGRFMDQVHSLIEEFSQTADETRARIDLYRNSIIGAAQKERTRERANNIANHLIESYLATGNMEVIEDVALAKPIYESLAEKSQDTSSCVSLIPRKCEVKSPLLSSKLLKTGCYIASGAAAITLFYGLNIHDPSPIHVVCSLIPATMAFNFGYFFKKHDAKKIAQAIHYLMKGLEDNYPLDEIPSPEEQPKEEQEAPQEEQQVIAPSAKPVVKDAYLNLIEYLLTYIQTHPDNDYKSESMALHQLSEYYYNAKKAEIKNGPAIAKFPFMQDLAEQEISIYAKNKDFRLSPTEPVNVNGEGLKNRLAFLGLSEETISHDYHIKQALSAVESIINNSYAGCEADIIRIFTLVYTYAERKINASEDLNQAGLDLLKGLRDIEQEIKLNHLEADYSVVSSSDITVDGTITPEENPGKGLKKAYPSES